MNILLTSAGRRTYIVEYFKNALEGKGLVHAANSDWSTALELADKAVITPEIYNNTYINFLIEYCEKNSIQAIIPLFDIDLPVLAKAIDRFEEIGVTVIVSKEESIAICNDKWETYHFLKKNKINCPKTYIVLKELKQDLKDKNISFPIIIKPRWGMGSIGLNIAHSLEELDFYYEKVLKDIKNSYLKFESQQKLDQSVLLQEFISGQEYGLDVINDLNSTFLTTVVKKKISMRAGETDVAQTIQDERLEKIGRKISHQLKHISNLDVDCFISENKIYVLEMNCRFGGGYPFSHIAGVNLPNAIIEWLSDKKTKSDYFNYKFNIKSAKTLDMIVLSN